MMGPLYVATGNNCHYQSVSGKAGDGSEKVSFSAGAASEHLH